MRWMTALLCGALAGLAPSVRAAQAPAPPQLESAALRVALDPASGCVRVVEKDTGTIWQQVSLPSPARWVVPRLLAPPDLTHPERAWSGAATLTVDGATSQPHRVQLAWDAQRLYLRAEVRDDVVIASPRGRQQYWESDSVECWIGAVQLTAIVGEGEGGVELRTAGAPAGPGPAQPPSNLYQPREAEQMALARGAGGYQIALAIPWANFPPELRPRAGVLQTALALAVNDADRPGQRRQQAVYPAGWRGGEFMTAAVAAFDPAATALATTAPAAATPFSFCRPWAIEQQNATTITARTTRLAFADGRLVDLPCAMTVALGPEPGDVTIACRPDPGPQFDELPNPLTFLPGVRDPWMVLPSSMGLLVPMRTSHPEYQNDILNNRGEFHSTQGINAACYGCVDPATGSGMLTIAATPWLGGYRPIYLPRPAAAGGDTVRQFYPTWWANLGHADREYRLVHHFAARGGYVALAKRYRQQVASQGNLVTLREKIARQPKAERALGAPVFWVTGRPDEVLDVARMMHADGLRRAVFNIEPYYYEVRGRADWAREMEQVVREVSRLGFLAARYDQYRDTHPTQADRPIYAQWNLEAYESMAARNKQGRIVGAFGPQARLINPVQALDLQRAHFDHYLARYDYDALFIDTLGYVPPVWDLDWRADHRTDVYAALDAKRELMREAVRRGRVVGTEFGSDWLLPWAIWLEGGMTINNFAWGVPGWGYQERPPEYARQLDPRYRIPFFMLVAGDCATVSWRWEDGMDRYPQDWQTKNLWTVLYGGAPMFFLNREAYLLNRERIVNTWRYVCEPVQQVAAGQELLSHRFVSEDRQVQESQFASGRGVVVNFGARPATLPGGREIAAHAYLTFTTQGATRVYQEPPVAPLDYDYRARAWSDVHEDFERGFGGALDVLEPCEQARFVGVTTQTTARIGGRWGLLATNADPGRTWVEYLATNRYLVPFELGQAYEVAFDTRYLGPRPAERLFCIARSGSDPGDFQEQVIWQPQPGEQSRRTLRFQVPPGVGNVQVFWGFHGVGQVAVDNVSIRKLAAADAPTTQTSAPLRDGFAEPAHARSFDPQRWRLFEAGLASIMQTGGGLRLQTAGTADWQSCGLLTQQLRPLGNGVRMRLRLNQVEARGGAIRVGLGLRGGSALASYHATPEAALDCFLVTDGHGAQLMVNSKPAGRPADNGDVGRQGAQLVPLPWALPLTLELWADGGQFRVACNGQPVASGSHTAAFGPWVAGELHVQDEGAGRGAAWVSDFSFE